MLATRDFLTANYIGEGSKIIFAGFFYQLPDTHRLQPVIREGILSMMPDEPIKTTTGKPATLYLGDIHSFGGNSGSPVFVDIAGIKPHAAKNRRPTGVLLQDFAYSAAAGLRKRSASWATAAVVA
jgi:hypothetical protein